jgi:hypothetical protein
MTDTVQLGNYEGSGSGDAAAYVSDVRADTGSGVADVRGVQVRQRLVQNSTSRWAASMFCAEFV